MDADDAAQGWEPVAAHDSNPVRVSSMQGWVMWSAYLLLCVLLGLLVYRVPAIRHSPARLGFCLGLALLIGTIGALRSLQPPRSPAAPEAD